jgi:hypothetical protein
VSMTPAEGRRRAAARGEALVPMFSPLPLSMLAGGSVPSCLVREEATCPIWSGVSR